MIPRMARFPSPAEQDIQDYFDAASRGEAGVDAASVKQAKDQNPQVAAQGQAAVQQQMRQNSATAQANAATAARQQQQDANDAQRAQDQALRQQEAQARQDAAAAAAEQQRQVRIAEQQGQVTATDPETGHKTIQTHPDGAPMWKAGPVGPPVQKMPAAAETQQQVQPVVPPSASPAAVVPGGQPAQPTWTQQYRNARGEVIEQPVPLKTDPKTAQSYIETQDEFGRPTRQVVGMDENAGAKLQLESDTADHALRHGNWQMVNERFKPIYDEANKDFTKAQARLEALSTQNTKIQKIDGKWKKFDGNAPVDVDGNIDPQFASPLGQTDAVMHQKRIDDAQQAFNAAKSRIDPLQPGYERLKATGEALEYQRLQLAQRKIRLESGLPDDDGGAATALAKSVGLIGASPDDNAIAKLVQGSPSPSGDAAAVPTDPATQKAFSGFNDIDGVTLEKRGIKSDAGTSYEWTALNRKGHWFGSIDGDAQNPIITLQPGAMNDPAIAKTVNFAGTDGIPLYMRDNPARQPLAKEAGWVASVFQADNEQYPNDGAKLDRLKELNATPDQLRAQVGNGEISKQHGEAILRGLWNDTLQTPDPVKAMATAAATVAAGGPDKVAPGGLTAQITGQSQAQAALPKPEGMFATAGRALASKLLPAATTAGGGLLAGTLAIESGPGAIVADIVGGAAGGIAGAALQKKIMGASWTEANEAQMQANAQANPMSAMFGDTVPFLISLLGGGGAGVKNAAGKLVTTEGGAIAKACTSAGKKAVLDAAKVPLIERMAHAAAGGARAGASESAQQKYVDGNKDASVLDGAARGALTFAATGVLPPAATLGAIGFFPIAKQVLTEATKRGVVDGAAMTFAGALYDAAVHGKPLDMAATAKDMGGSIPAFVLQNMVMGALHARGQAMANIKLDGIGKQVDSHLGDASDTPVTRDELQRASGMFAVPVDAGKTPKELIPQLAEHVMINRDLAANDARVKDATAALNAVPEDDMEAKIKAEQALQEAREVAGHADLTRAVTKMASGVTPEAMTPAEVNAFGYKRAADGKGIEPMKGDELAAAGLDAPLIYAGPDGSPIISDEALARVGKASPRALSQVSGSETDQHAASQAAADAKDATSSKPATTSTPDPVESAMGGSGGNAAAMDHAQYVAHQQDNPDAHSVVEVVDHAFQHHLPVSASMARESGLSVPAHYEQQGAMHVAKTIEAAPEHSAAAAVAAQVKTNAESAMPRLRGNIEVVNDEMGSGGVVVQADGRIRMSVPDIHRAIARAGGDPTKVAKYLQAFVERHEAVHVVQFSLVRSLWEKAGSKGDFSKFFCQWYGKELAPELLTEQAEKAARSIYGAKAWDAIGQRDDGTALPADEVAGLKAAEFVRMLVEAKLDPDKHGEFSELFRAIETKGVRSKVARLIRAAINMLKGMTLSDATKEHIALLEQLHSELSNAEPSSESEKTPSNDSEPTPPDPHHGSEESTGESAGIQTNPESSPQADAASIRQGGTGGEAQEHAADARKGLLDEQQAAGGQSPAADAWRIEPDGKGMSRVMRGDKEISVVPEDKAQAELESLKEHENSPMRIAGQVIKEAEKTFPALKQDGPRLELFGMIEDIAGVIGELPPEQRKAALTSAIAQWLDDNATRYADEAQPADGSQKPKTKRGRSIDSPAARKARQMIGSGDYPALEALFQSGTKIAPRPNILSLIQARKNNGAKLTNKEIAAMANKAEYDGAVMMSHFENSGNGAVARQMLSLLMARQGEGTRPDVMAGYLGHGLKADDLWQRLYAELKQVADGKGRAGSENDPNRENWTPEEIADHQAAQQAGGAQGTEAKQAANFHESNTPENGTEKEVSDFTEADIGSTVTVDGESMKVSEVHVNEITGDVESVTLDDHARFGRQVLEGGDVIYVEEETPAAPDPVKLGDMADAIEHGLGKGDDLADKARAFQPYENRMDPAEKADLVSAIEAEANRRAENVISAGEWQKNHQPDLNPRASALQRFIESHTLATLREAIAKMMPPDDVRLASSSEESPKSFSDVREFIRSNLSKPPNQYQYESTNENRSNVISAIKYLSGLGKRIEIVAPTELAIPVAKIERATGTTLAFFRSGEVKSVGFTTGRGPGVVFINSEKSNTPIMATFVHETVHIAQLQSKARGFLNAITQRLSDNEKFFVSRVMEWYGYQGNDARVELQAYFTSAAVTGHDADIFGKLQRGEEIRNALIGLFDALPKLSSGDAAQLASSPEESRPGRLRSASMVEFKKPFRGPSGAAMVAYEWKNQLVEGVDKRGEDKVERVSDWNKAATNWQTGREIVHHFHVDTPDGKTHVVSLESALKLLGYTSANGIASRPVKALASMVKTRATLTMEADALRPVVAEQLALNQRFHQERDALRHTPMPAPTFETAADGTPKMRIDGYLERFGAWANKADFDSTNARDLRDMADKWRDREAAKRAGGTGYGNEASKLSDLEARIAKMDHKIQEQSAAGANTPIDPSAITREEHQDAAAAAYAGNPPDMFSALLKEPPGPLAAVKERAQAAHDAQPKGSKARENIAAAMAQREGRTGPPAFKSGQGVMDFGASGGGSNKGQQEFGLMASPDNRQRAFDFGTSGGFGTKNQPGFDFTAKKVDDAAKETDPDPTPAQIEAGNYAKGKVMLHGMPISIENAKGSTRSGTDKAGKPWSVEMQAHYGYFLGTEGRDKDHVDVFIGPDPSNTKAFVVNQIDPTTGRFDEHKILLGYGSRQEAIAGYKANYAPGWKGLGSMVETTTDSLREWLKTEDTKKPAKTDDFKPAEAATVKDSLSVQPVVKDSLTTDPTVKDSLTVAPPAIEPGTPDFRLLPVVDKKNAVKAASARKQAERAGGVQDFGEKIGGARKDQAIKTGPTGIKKPTDERPAWARRYEIGEMVSSSTPGEVGRFSIRDLKNTDWRGQPRRATEQTFTTREEAEAAVPLLAVSRNHKVRMVKVEGSNPAEYTYSIWRDVTDHKRVQVVKQDFPSREDAMRFMAAHAADIIDTKTSFREELFDTPQKAVRSGKDRRTGPATADMFQNDFGFRGVEFGNWMRQTGDGKERQEVLNHAYDGLHDLAEVLGVPTKAMSLNGELGLAFGARGQGLQGAKAHYERNYATINLTKMSGAGSLAHEFFHALDHYLGRQDGKAKGEMVKSATGDMVYPASTSAGGDYVSHGFSYNSKTREELRSAYNNVMKTIATKAVEFVHDSENSERFVKAARTDLETRLKEIRSDLTRAPHPEYEKRRKPATPAQLEEFDRLTADLLEGNGLETEFRLKNPDSTARHGSFTGRNTNDTLEAISAIRKAVTGRAGFDSTNHNGPLDYLRGSMGRYQQRIAMLESAAKSEVNVKKAPTDYAMNAKRIDQGGATDYWTTPHELAARAFSAYVEDKVADSGGKSDFLSYGSDNNLAKYRIFKVKPFPEGAERVAINGAFDKLFSTIKAEPTDKGVALFSSPESDENTRQTNEKHPESPHADQSQQPAKGEDGARSSGYVSRQLAEELSPERKPHIYGQGFHSESEVIRQRGKLIEIAEAKGLLLNAQDEARIRRDAKAFDEGQEHEVFRENREWVTKITKKDSWAVGTAPAQYFSRWADLGILFPKLEPQVVGVLPDGRIVVRQEFVNGATFDSVESLQAAMAANGWEKLGGSKYRHIKTGAVISDARPPNVIHDADGNVWPFDVVVHDVGKNQDILKSSPTSDDAPDLLAATNAPDAREALGDVRAGSVHALNAYKQLTAKRERMGVLSGAEEETLLKAETALGQKLAFDMEAVKSKEYPIATHRPDPQRQAPSRATQQGMNLGEDGPGGQMQLLSSPQDGDSDAQKAARQALERMPALFHNVFNDITAGATGKQVMERYKVNEKQVTNILNQVRSRMEAATGAAGPDGLNPVMQGDQFKGGRPKLALSGNARVTAVDQIRQKNNEPDVRGHAGVNEEAAAMLQKDYQGTYDQMLDIARDRQQMSDTQVAATKHIISRETLSGKIQTPEERVKIALLIHGYRDIGTDTARALAMRVDPDMTPAQRNARFIAEALFTPDAKTRERLRNAKSGAAETVLAGWMKRVDGIKSELLAQGIDIDATLARYNADIEARKQAEAESPRAAKVIDETIRKLNPQEKLVINAIRDGALVSKAAFIAGIDHDDVKSIYSRFMGDIRTAMATSAKRFLEGSLAASPQDSMGRILADLGFPDLEAIDDTKPDFVDRRGEKPQAPRAPRKPREAKPAEPRKPTLVEPSPEAQAKLDEAWERFKASDFKGTEAFAKELKLYPINETRGTWDPTVPNREKSLFPQPINERTGIFDIHDPIAVKRVMDAFAVARGGKMDAMMEYWRMALLTGPHTAVVNATSHAMHAFYNLAPRRAVEATINNVLGLVGQGSEKAATFGEFLPIVRHLHQAAQMAGRMAVNSWKIENRVFEAYAKATPLQLDFTGVGGEYIPPALGGKFGKIMRSISFRAMTTADEFIKGFYGQLEAAAQAHRMAAVEEKLSGPAYEARFNELVQPGSEAWVRAFDKTMVVGFQEHLNGENPQAICRLDQLSQLAKHGRAMPWIGRPLMFFFPFIDTPTNLVKLATEMSPIGAFLSVVDGTRALKQRIFRGDLTPAEAQEAASKLYDRARFVKDLTNQTIGLAAGYALMSMVSPNDKDDSGLPIITGTVPYKTTKRGERDNAMATMPPMTIRIPGTKLMFDYSRFEPFSMTMAASVDGLMLYNRNGGMKPGVVSEWLARFKDQMKDKTFLQGLSNLTNALEDPDRFVERLLSGIVTSFVPNLIRQVVKEADPVQRDLHPKAEDGLFKTLANDVGYSIHPQAAPAKIDVWGNDIPRHRGEKVGGSDTSDFLFRVIDPTKSTYGAKSDPVDLYIFNYNLQTAESTDRIGINPISDSMSIRFPGTDKPQKVALSQEQYTNVNRQAGKMARQMLGDDWDWRNPTPEGAKRITETVRRAQESARAQMHAQLMAAGPPAK